MPRVVGGGGGGLSEAEVQALIDASLVTDHGELDGLGDDDHTQYAKKASNLSDLSDAAAARANLGLTDAWTAFTPTWSCAGTPPAIGNGSLVGAYRLLGRTLQVRIQMVAGSTTTFGTVSNGWTVTLPSGLVAIAGAFQTINGYLRDATGNFYGACIRIAASAGNGALFSLHGVGANVSAQSPFTWATSDEFVFNGVIEVA